MLISQHTSAVRWRLGYATASQGQDQARVKESRYVIKVMRIKQGGVWRSLGLSEPKDVPHLLIG